MKQIGIWLDKRTAYIISQNESDSLDMKVVASNIEEFHVSGGSGTKFKGGPQNVIHDRKYLEREKHQTKHYFQTLVNEIEDAEKLVLFGPGVMPNKFQKELDENYANIAVKVEDVIPADSMSKNQMKAWVKDYFDKINQEYNT